MTKSDNAPLQLSSVDVRRTYITEHIGGALEKLYLLAHLSSVIKHNTSRPVGFFPCSLFLLPTPPFCISLPILSCMSVAESLAEDCIALNFTTFLLYRIVWASLQVVIEPFFVPRLARISHCPSGCGTSRLLLLSAAKMAAVSSTDTAQPQQSELSREDQTLLLFAGLMEGGKEDDDTINELDRLTKVLNDDVEATKKGEASICSLIDSDCADTLLSYLDMRQADVVRGHATLTTSAYLKAAGDDGAQKLSEFFYERVKRGTYDDYIVAFCVAAAVFPIVPDLTAELFLSEGFLASLGPLMRRKWKSRKVETACLDMLNVACMNTACREAVQKYCVEWLEEIVDQDPDDVVKDMFAVNPDGSVGEGSISMRRHSRQVQNLAAVILAKLKVRFDCFSNSFWPPFCGLSLSN